MFGMRDRLACLALLLGCLLAAGCTGGYHSAPGPQSSQAVDELNGRGSDGGGGGGGGM